MLIELGPTPLLRRGTDWDVGIRYNGEPYVFAQFDIFRRYCYAGGYGNKYVVFLSARMYGFDIGDALGTITNWDDVPHLWEPADVD